MLQSNSGTTGLQSLTWMSEQSPGKGNPTKKSHSELAPSKILDTVLVSVRICASRFWGRACDSCGQHTGMVQEGSGQAGQQGSVLSYNHSLRARARGSSQPRWEL